MARPLSQKSGVRSQESEEPHVMVSFRAQMPMILRPTTRDENARSALECGSSSYRLLMFPSLGVRKPSRFLLYTLRCRTQSKGGSCCYRTPRAAARAPPYNQVAVCAFGPGPRCCACHSERSDPSPEGFGPQDEESRSGFCFRPTPYSSVRYKSGGRRSLPSSRFLLPATLSLRFCHGILGRTPTTSDGQACWPFISLAMI